MHSIMPFRKDNTMLTTNIYSEFNFCLSLCCRSNCFFSHQSANPERNPDAEREENKLFAPHRAHAEIAHTAVECGHIPCTPFLANVISATEHKQNTQKHSKNEAQLDPYLRVRAPIGGVENGTSQDENKETTPPNLPSHVVFVTRAPHERRMK